MEIASINNTLDGLKGLEKSQMKLMWSQEFKQVTEAALKNSNYLKKKKHP